MSNLGRTAEEPFVIDRGKWLRGPMCIRASPYFVAQSQLWCEKNCGCCIGLVGIEGGIEASRLLDMGSPEQAYRKGIEESEPMKGSIYDAFLWDSDFTTYDNPTTEDLIRINDDDGLTETDRESQLTANFAEIGIFVRFEGPFAKWDERAVAPPTQ